MALSRIRCSKDLPTVLSRVTNSATGRLGEVHSIRQGLKSVNSGRSGGKADFHFSGVRRYPEAPRLPLPSNVSEIFGNETGRFTPDRARDIAAPVLAYVQAGGVQGSHQGPMKRTFDVNSSNWGPVHRVSSDTHVDSYDCFGAVSLNSTMQSNVPIPFCSSGKASHFNMPGGQWAKDGKYIAEDMQKSHYKSVRDREHHRKGRSNGALTNTVLTNLTPPVSCTRHVSFLAYSTASSTPEKSGATTGSNNDTSAVPLTNGQKLKKAVKDYGSTVIVFHVGISLLSLGACYVAISSGLDVQTLVKTISYGANERIENAMANSSTFLVAYAVHKLFAPVRISITLGATPFVVKYLRRVGILKMPKK